MNRLFFLLTLCFFISGAVLPVLPSHAGTELKEAVFFRPDKEKGAFWTLFQDVLQAACDDLGIGLSVLHVPSDPFLTVRTAKDIAADPSPPDLVLLPIQGNVGEQVLRVFEDAGIDVFVVNNGFPPEQIAAAGLPRQKYKHWIGQITPDDEKAGQDIATYLYNRVKDRNLHRGGPVRMVAVDGVYNTRASQDRGRGLKNARGLHDDLMLDASIEGHWDPALARTAARRILQQNPGTQAVWSISDQTAIGVYQAAADLGKTPGQDILIAGIDWIPEIFDYIRDGHIEASLGGHFMEGAWAVIMAYDYKNGHDFADSVGVTVQSRMQIIDRHNVEKFAPLLEHENWERLDFKRFTRTHNPERLSYDFDVLEVLKDTAP